MFDAYVSQIWTSMYRKTFMKTYWPIVRINGLSLNHLVLKFIYDLWVKSTKTFLSNRDHATTPKSSEKCFSIKWYIVVELLTKTTKIVANKYHARPVDCSNPPEASNQLYQHCNAHALFWFELTKHVFNRRWFISNWIYSEMCNSS